jgi:hypothetical protein
MQYLIQQIVLSVINNRVSFVPYLHVRPVRDRYQGGIYKGITVQQILLTDARV